MEHDLDLALAKYMLGKSHVDYITFVTGTTFAGRNAYHCSWDEFHECIRDRSAASLRFPLSINVVGKDNGWWLTYDCVYREWEFHMQPEKPSEHKVPTGNDLFLL